MGNHARILSKYARHISHPLAATTYEQGNQTRQNFSGHLKNMKNLSDPKVDRPMNVRDY